MDTSKRLRSADLMFLPPDMDKQNAPSMEEQMAVHLNGQKDEHATLGAGGIRLTRFNQPALDIDPDKPINADAIKKIDSDVENLRKILYRIIIAEFVQDDRIQTSFDLFLSRYRAACLDLMDRRDLGGNVSTLVGPLVQLIINPIPQAVNDVALVLSDTQTEILKGLTKQWAIKTFPVYKLSYLVAGVLGFQEPRNLLIFNYIDTMMNLGISEVRGIDGIGGDNTLFKVMVALLTGQANPVFAADGNTHGDILKRISPYYDVDHLNDWEGVLSSALQMAVNQAYDFIRNHVAVRTKRSSSSSSTLRTRYMHLIENGVIQKRVLFDDYREDRPGYISFNPELINLVAAYIPRNWAVQNLENRAGVEMLNIAKRQSELLLKLGLMGI